MLSIYYVLQHSEDYSAIRRLQITRWIPRMMREFERSSVRWENKLKKARLLALYNNTCEPRVHVISLARTRARRAQLTEELHNERAQFDVFTAVDGSMDLAYRDILRYAGPKKQQKMTSITPLNTPSEKNEQHERLRFGCYMSHVRLWELQIELSTPHQVILEDDVHLREGFLEDINHALQNLPIQWDIFYLASCHTKVGGFLRPGIRQVKGALCTHGYVISLSGAIKLVGKYALNSEKPVDHMLDEVICRSLLVAFHADPPLVFPQAASSTLAYPSPG